MKILLKNCLLLQRGEKEYFTIPNAFVLVNDNIIAYIGQGRPKEAVDIEKDLSNCLVMPGLINAHGHSPMTLLRGCGGGLNLQDWLNKAIFPIEDKMKPEDIEAGCRFAIMEMLSSGTTQFSEMYDFPYASAKAIAESGIKANICRVGLCFDPNIQMKDWERFSQIISVAKNLNGCGVIDNEYKNELHTDKKLEIIEKAIEEDRIRGDVSLHSEYLTTETFAREISKFNKEMNFKAQVHASETYKEHQECIAHRGMTPIEYLKEVGYLDGGNAYLAHCVHATSNDLKILKDTGSTLVFNPSSNMKLGSGLAPIKEALKIGVNVALGTDGCASNNNLDMFEEMHVAALQICGKEKDPTAVSVTEIIDMATINGAKALGRLDTGKLEVGMKADIIAIDLSKPHLYPIHSASDLIVYSCHGSDVCFTMVDGKVLYENGKYLTIDIDKAYNEFNKSLDRLFK